MSSLNKVFLIGRLGSDPEVRTIQNGKNVSSFSLATSEKIGTETRTEWHRVIAWDKLSDVVSKFLKKGNNVHLEGRIQSREYKGNDGMNRKIYEIICQNLTLIDSGNKKFDAVAVVEEVPKFDDDIPF